MTIRYEINPPKVTQEIIQNQELQKSVNQLKDKIIQLEKICDGIHITDSVLGIPRISPITMGSIIRNEVKKLKITVSLRVIDRNLTSLTQAVCDVALLGLDGILILKGDAPKNDTNKSDINPSQVVKHFKELDFQKNLEFYLSLPTNPDFNKIRKKIDAKPTGFITQVISSVEQVSRIVNELEPQGFKIIPCIIIPSEKNSKSADFLGLDWSNYKDDVTGFIKEIHQITGDVLISSPNDFNGAYETLTKLSS